jgi:hypothetical protein
MTPAEQALELVDKFEHAKKYANSSNAMSRELAKECAKIAARLLKRQYIEMQTIKGPAKANYWDEVKQEIEKI